MRPITVLLCLVLCVPLAACLSAGATGDTKPDVTAAPQPAASPMPAGRAATAPKPPRGAAAQASAQASASAKKDEWWQEGGVTREKINGMCWMKAEESGGRGMPAEKKADIVNKCVAETLRQYPLN